MGEEERKKPTRRVNELRRLIDSGRLPVGTNLTASWSQNRTGENYDRGAKRCAYW